MNSILLTCAFAASLMTAGATRPPNIVILYADDMGIGDLGCYGATDIRTPNIDALARGGMRFTNYYSAAPICSPSRAALMTGRYPIRAGVPSNCSSQPGVAGMPTEEVTIAELARTRGYATALIGKWHLGFSKDTQPNEQGFDYFFGHHAGCIDYYSHWFYWQEPHHHDLYRNREEIREEGSYFTDLIVREARRFIVDHVDKPFLLYVPFNAPHYPHQAPERIRRSYDNLPAQRADYAAVVTAMDEAIGAILQTLRERGLERDTLVFFISDNGATTEARANYGGGSNAPYRGFKFSLFDGGIHMPAIVSRPGTIPAGKTCNQLAIAMDVFPTVAEAIGADLPTGRTIDGRSWRPLLEGKSNPIHDVLFWSQEKQGAVRKGKWKLVLNGRDANQIRPASTAKPASVRTASASESASARTASASEPAPFIAPSTTQPTPRPKNEDKIFLADLETDPGETMNLRDKHPKIVRELTDLHESWLKSLKSSIKQ